MNDYREMLKCIYVDMRLDEESEEIWPSERMMTWKHEIEKIFDQEELDLAHERFVKTDSDHLYKGAEVRVKRDMYYGDLMHDPEGQEPNAKPYLYKGDIGEIVEDTLDEEESDYGYYDCAVSFRDMSGSWLMRVEWLEWTEDDEDDED